MDSKDHGSSIITRLRLIIERMPADGEDERCSILHAEAERLLPIADVDDIEVIVLREAAAILNGRGWCDLSDKVEAAGDAFAYAETVPMTEHEHGSMRGGIAQHEAEAIAYDAVNTFITRSSAPIPLTHEGLNTIRNAAQQALERHAPGQWVVGAALPDSDWSRTPAVTVRPADATRAGQFMEDSSTWKPGR